MRARSRTALALALAASAATLAAAHGDYAEVDENPDATYAELHMAQEVRPSLPLYWTHSRSLPLCPPTRLLGVQHHMDSFDIQAFFHLHDLNRCVTHTHTHSHTRGAC